jgi:hypothetical protein
MKYEQWRKLAVAVTDLRVLNIDGITDLPEPAPGVAFMKPDIHVAFDGGQYPDKFHPAGYIFQQKSGLWLVQICNTEREFVDFEVAALYLWDQWVRHELDVMPYLLIQVDREGEIVFQRKCVSEQHMLETAANQLPDLDEPAYAKANLEADLGRVGARFHEFGGGHFAAFPLELE